MLISVGMSTFARRIRSSNGLKLPPAVCDRNEMRQEPGEDVKVECALD